MLRAAIEAADPARLVREALALGVLDFPFNRARLVAAGKAADAMAAALAGAVSLRAGVIAAPGAARTPVAGLDRCEAGHPRPNRASARAAEQALRLARETEPDDVLIVLVSGGASAMLCAPAEGISIEDKADASDAMMRAGAPIGELNCVRRHLSRIKGGRLAAAAARSVTLALSDVHGPVPDDPSVIGSGPTVADPTGYPAALRSVTTRGARVPAAVRAHLERGARGEVEETPKPGDPRLARASYALVGNRHTALEGALRAAQARGYTAVVLPEPTAGEARDAAAAFLAEARWVAGGAARPLCVLAAGETTVTAHGDGLGGRNQEFALAAAPGLGAIGRAAIVASAGTDGIDGPTDAAGASADSTTLERASRAGLDWRAALDRHDAYRFFEPLGDLIRLGATGTNVGDIQILLIA